MALRSLRSMRLRLLASLGVFLWSVGVLFPRNGEIIRRGLDLRGGTAVTLEIAKESLAENVQDRANQLKKVVEIMGKRVDALGVSEPIIRARGNAQVEVQLADVFAVNNRDLINVIKKPAKLEFRLLHEHTVGEDSDLLPPGYEFIPHEFMDEETGVMQSRPVMVRRVPELGGAAIRRASAVVNSYGVHEVSLELTADGAKKFERITRRNVGKSLGIVLDGKLYSAPVIRSVISDGHAAISGNFTQKSATDLANILNNPLEFELRVVEVRELGPTLAKEVQSSSMKAAYIGSASVMVFMLLCNVVGGLVSIISILFNVLIILAVLVTIGGTMTLPAIAALVLTIGMGVDSNIITYARMREEISQKKSMEKAVKFGFERAFVSIMDANLTTLLTAAVLIFYGMGSIRGFGIILAIGIISNLFCSLVFTRGALEFLQNISLLRSFSFPQWKNHIHFMHMRKIAIIISLPLLIATVWQTHARGQDIYGIDFRGGEEYVLTFGEPPLLESITQAAERANIREVVSSFQRSIRDGAEELKLQLPIGKGEELLEALEEAMPQCHFQVQRKTTIGASMSAELRKNAVISIAIAVVAMMLYIAVRFEMGFAVGAIASTIHDVLITAGIYLSLGHQWSAPMLASLLMIIGYSINDTVIIFDRIREELPKNPQKNLLSIIDYAIGVTLPRTILTSLTTFLAAISLYVFGSGVVKDLSLIFMIGIVVGTFSSIFIACPAFYWWHRGNRERLDKKILPFEER